MAIQHSQQGVEVIHASDRCTHYAGTEAALRRRMAALVGVHFPTPNFDDNYCFKVWEDDGRQFLLRRKFLSGAHQQAKDLRPDYWWLRVVRLTEDEEAEE